MTPVQAIVSKGDWFARIHGVAFHPGSSPIKAFVYRRYGSPEVVEMVELAKPVPADHEILVRILATTVSSGDWRMRALEMPAGFGPLGRLVVGITGPRQPILGSELAGVVEAVGGAVTTFKPGDRVFAFPGMRMGCHAEYRCIAVDGPVALTPANLSDAQAAALCFGGATMLDFFRRAELRRGERVLVNGASGAVGTAAVQLAKHAGAEVTGVCSTANLALVQSIGADHVVDYTQADFAAAGRTYDVIVDTAGTAPFARSAPALAEGGRLLLVLAGLMDMIKAPFARMTGTKKVIAGPTAERVAYVHELARIAAAGGFTPVIDSCYLFAQMREAHRRVDSGRKRGNVVIRVAERPGTD